MFATRCFSNTNFTGRRFNLDGDIVPLNKNKLIHTSEFRLKRQKPVLDNNTLDNIMNLIYNYFYIFIYAY